MAKNSLESSNVISEETIKFLDKYIYDTGLSQITAWSQIPGFIEETGLGQLAVWSKTPNCANAGHYADTGLSQITAWSQIPDLIEERGLEQITLRNPIEEVGLGRLAVWSKTPNCANAGHYAEVLDLYREYIDPEGGRSMAYTVAFLDGWSIYRGTEAQKSSVFNDDILACLYGDKSDNALPWELIDLIGCYAALPQSWLLQARITESPKSSIFNDNNLACFYGDKSDNALKSCITNDDILVCLHGDKSDNALPEVVELIGSYMTMDQ